jgi:hypothetical protein
MMSGIVFLPVNVDLPSRALDAMADLVDQCTAGAVVEEVA